MNQHNEMNTNHAKTLDSNYKKHIWWWHECPAVGQRSPLGLVDSHGKRGKGGFRISPIPPTFATISVLNRASGAPGTDLRLCPPFIINTDL
jgi:hypothetical protein